VLVANSGEEVDLSAGTVGGGGAVGVQAPD
jgi:hypothetical protein